MKLQLIVLFSILQAITGFYISNNSSKKPDTASRIVGGLDAEDGIAPYQCSLQLNRSHICGCSIISTEWILTAAHCVEGLYPSDLDVLVGTNDLESGGTYYNVKKYIQHEKYTEPPSKFSNDIAVIKVRESIIFNDKVQPIEYSPEEVPDNTVTRLTGWGKLITGGPVSRFLQTLNMTTLSRSVCQQRIGRNYVQESHLCTINEKGQGFCNGDSGGPLVLNNKQVGIVNFGPNTCANGYPNVFANVAYMYDWIKTNAQ